MVQFKHDPELHLVDSIDEAFAMKRWLGERREFNILGLDTETSGLSPYLPNSKLRTIQIGDHRTGWTVPWEQWGGAALECLNDWKGGIALHNASFDAKWLKIHAGYNIPWDRTFDTMIMAQLVAPREPSKGLKELSTKFVDYRANMEQKELKKIFKDNDWDWDTVPVDLPVYWMYSALDPVLTCHLWSQFPAHEIYPKSFDLEMATLRITTNMEHKGMRVDIDYSEQKHAEIMGEVELAKKKFQDTYGVSMASTKQLVGLFEKYWGSRIFTERTASGAPSVNEKQLSIFTTSEDRNLAELAKFILKVRGREKKGNSYFKNFVEMQQDGLLHANIKTMGARTGRMSVTNPALQTIPSDDSEVRNAFIPNNPGDIIVSCDYSQMELRLLAHFSKDKKLQEAFHDADRTGGDFFSNLGKEIYQNPDFDKSNPKRGLVKSTMYGLIYGAGPAKLAQTAGIPISEMEPVVEGVHKTFPGIKQFMKDTERDGQRREREEGEAYIEMETGRKIPADEGKIYTLVNYMLQGTGAELLKKSLVRLDAAGFSDALVVPIHDEVIFSMPEEDAKDALPIIEEIMSYKDGQFAVDQLAEPEIAGNRWGNKYAK